MAEAPTAALPDEAAVARLLCDVRGLAAEGPGAGSVLWKLAESGRQLDANLIRLPAGTRIDTHAEPDLDVLLLVVTGDGTMDTADGALELAEGSLVWLPHGSTRSITAGAAGLAYVTVHRRRPGMQIRRRTELTSVPARPEGS